MAKAQLDPFRVLGVSDGAIRARSDLDKLRQRSKELYKRYSKEKRQSDADRVLQAFEVLKKRFEPSLAKPSGTNTSSTRTPAATSGRPPDKQPPSTTHNKQAMSSKAKLVGHADKAAPAGTRTVVPGSSRSLVAGVKSLVPGSKTTSLKHADQSAKRPADKKDLGVGVPHKRAKEASASNIDRPTPSPPATSAVAGPKLEARPALRCACGKEGQVRKRVASSVEAAAFQCPACIFRKMDPFNPVLDGSAGVMRLVMVQPPLVSRTARQEAKFKLHLNLPRLQEWRKKGHNVEVRMCCLDSFLPHQAWPNQLTFSVNGRQSFQIDPPAPGHKRRDVPKCISADLHSGANALEVIVKDDYVQRFAMALVRTVPQVPVQLCKRVAPKGEEESKQKLTDLLFSSMLEGSGSEVQCAGSADKSSLLCPITWSRMRTAVRGTKCRHLQCFDLSGFMTANLRMAAVNKRWACPVCDLDLRPPGDIFIDMYHMRVLAEAGPDAEEVMFSADGSWKVTSWLSPASDEEEETKPDAPATAVTDQDTLNAEDGPDIFMASGSALSCVTPASIADEEEKHEAPGMSQEDGPDAEEEVAFIGSVLSCASPASATNEGEQQKAPETERATEVTQEDEPHLVSVVDPQTAGAQAGMGEEMDINRTDGPVQDLSVSQSPTVVGDKDELVVARDNAVTEDASGVKRPREDGECSVKEAVKRLRAVMALSLEEESSSDGEL